MVKTPNYVIEVNTAAAVSDYSLSYICDTKDQTDHHHHCIKIAVSLDHHFDCLVDGTLVSGLKGIIINEETPHSFVSPDVSILFNYIKTDTLHGKQLLLLLKGRPWLDINQVLQNFNESRVLPDDYKDLAAWELVPPVNQFLDSVCFVVQEKKAAGDARIRAALELIEQNLNQELVIELATEKIHLSPDRARHIFAQEVGVPIAQFILWKRIRSTIKLAAQPDESFIDACMKSGFYDQNHFNRAFRLIFQLRPLPIILHYKVII